MKAALDELRACCRTRLALQSFEDFEKQLKRKSLKHTENKPPCGFYIPSPESKTSLLARNYKPRSGWHFGQNQTSSLMKSKTTEDSDTTRPMLMKSTTMSNLASSRNASSGQAAVITSTAGAESETLVKDRPLYSGAHAHQTPLWQERRLVMAGRTLSTGARKGNGTGTETLKKVFSDSMRGVRRIRRSITGSSGENE